MSWLFNRLLVTDIPLTSVVIERIFRVSRIVEFITNMVMDS